MVGISLIGSVSLGCEQQTYTWLESGRRHTQHCEGSRDKIGGCCSYSFALVIAVLFRSLFTCCGVYWLTPFLAILSPETEAVSPYLHIAILHGLLMYYRTYPLAPTEVSIDVIQENMHQAEQDPGG
jgi:hypothetical protein